MKLKHIFVAALFVAGAPAQAQNSSPAPAALKTHEAAAVRVVDRLWPAGTYRRMLDGTMSGMIDRIMQSMFGMKASDIIPPDGEDAARKETGDKTLLQMAEEKDPHFRERMTIFVDVMTREMIPLIEKVEPSMRDSLTRIYARDYTEAQLVELEAFLRTPTGQVFGRNWMMGFVDPEMVASMAKLTPMMMQAMPEIMKKVEAATAHLPPLPKKGA